MRVLRSTSSLALLALGACSAAPAGGGGGGGSAASDFLDAMPAAFCEFLIGCGEVPADGRADCEAEVHRKTDKLDPACPALVAFVDANSAELDRCLAGEAGDCAGDDVEGFCPVLGNFDDGACEETGSGGSGGAGRPGRACTGDHDCGAGLRCLNSIVVGTSRYCALPCDASGNGCDAQPWVSYQIALEPSLAAQNQWNAPTLSRAVGCVDLADYPGAGTDDGGHWCVFGCPDNAAAELDERGYVVACSCLPNFHDGLVGEGLDCAWDDSTECSIFKPCVAAVTQDPACSGEVTCLVGETLDGSCVELRSGEQIEACVAHCTADSCDATCLAGCSGEACVDACCSWSCP